MTGEPDLRARESEEAQTSDSPAEPPAEDQQAAPADGPEEQAPAPAPPAPAAPPTAAPRTAATSLPPDLPNPKPAPAPAPEPVVESVPAPEPAAQPEAKPQAEPESAPEPVAAAPPPQPPSPEEPVHDVPGIPAADAGDAEDDEPTEIYEELLESAAPPAAELRVGDRRLGHVVSVSEEGVVVDIGAKTEGFISLRDAPPEEERPKFNVGDELPVVVVRLGDPGEYAHLAPARDENREALDALEKSHQDKQPVTAKVLERVKGGLTVDVGVPAFLPGSQVALRGVQNLDALIGQEFPVLIVKMSRRRGNVVVSRRAVLEEETNKLKQETLSKLELGGEATGTVKNVTSYGAFVDLGGIDGLIHVTDISHGRLKDPSEALTPGQEITAKVIKLDREKERVSLSLKQMEPDPWEGVTERYHPEDKVSGEVASITDYGAFIELETGVEGLVHISELTWSKRLRHPSKVLKVGQSVDAVVLKVQPSSRRISLSLKHLAPDPWDSLGEEFDIGSIVEGRVRNVTSYGAFVEVREGIDGLVHVSDLSWDSSVRNPKEVLKKGEMIKAVVLGVDRENRRMSFGVKQLQPDVWETFFSQYAVSDVIIGQVTRHVKFGVFVQLAEGVEGLCHNSEMPPRSQRKGKQRLEKGRRYEFEIIRLDEFDRRIGLRAKSYEMVDPDPVETAPPKPDPPPSVEPASQPSEESSEAAAQQPEAAAVEEPQVAPREETEAPAAPEERAEPQAEEPAEQPEAAEAAESQGA